MSRLLPWLALAAAVFLCMLGALGAGTRIGRLAERLESKERADAANRRMLEAGAARPRDRAELVDRLRDEGF